MTRPILLVNLGSPASPQPADVARYLDEFLMDPDVLDIAAPLRAALVKGIIVPTRSKTSARAYAKIWTAAGSPLIVFSEAIRSALERRTGVPVGLAMRYGEPAIGRAIDDLLARSASGATMTVVPLYPHYAMASTRTVETAVAAACAARGIAYAITPPFFDAARYLDALAARIRADAPADRDYLLFSYHGIPQRHLRKVDPTGGHCRGGAGACCQTPSPAHATCYRHQVIAATHGVAARLGLSPDRYGIAFQSRLGSGWLQPFTDRELAELPGRGVKRLAVVCPSFVADCLETLEEMALRGRETFLAAGGREFTYVRCLNDDAAWIDALAELSANAAVAP